MPWPAVIMMSPMMVAAEGFAAKKSNILMALAFFLYPIVVFLALYLIGYSFYGTDPLWWAAAVFVVGSIVSVLYGLPRKFYNVSTTKLDTKHKASFNH